MKWKLNRIQSG